jgi:hypothetical protein
MTCSCNHFCLGRQHLPSTIQKRGFVQEWGILIPQIYRLFMFFSPYFPANWPFRGIPGFIRCPFSRSRVPLVPGHHADICRPVTAHVPPPCWQRRASGRSAVGIGTHPGRRSPPWHQPQFGTNVGY